MVAVRPSTLSLSLLLVAIAVKVVPLSSWTIPSPSPRHRTAVHRRAPPHSDGWRLINSALGHATAGSRLYRRSIISPSSSQSPPRDTKIGTTVLYGGTGVAATYNWTEEQYEIDVTVPVPPGTRSRDIVFRAKRDSVDLRLRVGGKGEKSGGGDGDSDSNEVVLLDGTRRMRGNVSVDGTYWAISDADHFGVPGSADDAREVTVTIEKMIADPQDQFEVVEYDWGGVYPDDELEVWERLYDEPEELDVREYAASLGVDIDNINMSLVDKTMFGSGLNMTRSALDELTKGGYVNEVTQQGDGTEYTTDEETGSAVPFSPLGDAVGDDELRDANLVGASAGGGGGKSGMDSIRSQLPFIDTHSQWHKSMPVEEARDVTDGSPLQSGDDGDDEGGTAITGGVDELGQTTDEGVGSDEQKDVVTEEKVDDADAVDPIDKLTVKRLKEILREQNLKVGGNKQELRDRLRNHVNSLADSSGNDDGN